MDRSRPFNSTERAAEKQASRDEDAAALKSGEKSSEELRRENAAFAFPRLRMSLRNARAPK